MDAGLTPSELKTILHSKRSNIYYLQYCRVLVNGCRVEYITEEGKQSLYWNIPIANTTVVMLGTGTSVTQAAMREFARAGVLVVFFGGLDLANRFLDHGNYLAYGLAATAVWVIGLPHGLAVMHGKTRRGGLVFDVADIIKDALILPQAFIAAMKGEDEQEFRQRCLSNFQRSEALDVMIEVLQNVAQQFSQVSK
jgi:CRISPR/Cas system-associated endonuclease Cas1